MTLHEAIVKLLEQKDRPMSTSEIASELNRNNWYIKKDGSLITPYQIHGRTRNYPHLFTRKGAIVTLVNQPISKTSIKSSTKKSDSINPYIETTNVEVEKHLLDERRFRKAKEIDSIVPDIPGLYCIRISNPSRLPRIFYNELNKRGNNLIYIGEASQSLQTRLLQQELRGSGHGTFFRSIGCVLGYKPPVGSLVYKKNKYNFKFSPDDENRIISWINQNLLINWIEIDRSTRTTDSSLIAKYNPLLNIEGNPKAMDELKELRTECIRVANNK